MNARSVAAPARRAGSRSRRPTSTGSRSRCCCAGAAAALPLIGSSSTWVTLTVAGLAMGLIIFIIASGLTLVFGLMDVLNFGHGVFIALGAFVATSVLGGMADWTAGAIAVAQPGARSSPRCWWRWPWPARSAWPSSA